MIVHSNETKSKPSLIDLLGGGKSPKEKSGNAFSGLLLSLSETLKGGKSHLKPEAISPLIDSKQAQGVGKSPKTAELQTLLGTQEENELKMLPKELLDLLGNDQVRSLIYRAKEYLKNQILSKSPEQQLDPKSLPKTLMGLVQLADKMGLEPQLITLSTLNEGQKEPFSLPAPLQTQLLLNPKALQESPKEATAQEMFETITRLISEAHTKESKPKEGKKEGISEQPLKSLLQMEKPAESTLTEVPKPQTKESRHTSANNDLLISLLHGEAKTQEGESLSGENKKVDADISKHSSHASSLKADSVDVKIKEAQQSMRYFATDLKEAVENYKPPFTKLTMKLNPERLGEVEVTLVQRGNNVHVNIQSSNTNSVAFLAHNATELKAQLAHQGITNATMNFMSGGEGQQQNNPQQNQHHQNRFRNYQSFEELELNNEQLSALELIIPHYA